MFPNLFSRGMFVDGEYYATIARNLARGQGTLWTPVFTASDSHFFYDHPPLVFGIESIFFRVLGNSYLVEKLYSFITFMISALLIAKIWKSTVGDSQYSWLPLILWVLTPLTYWAYVNNLLENTMGVFCLACFAFLLNAWHQKKNILLNYFLAGISLSAALLSKGPVGLFPLAIPFLYWVSTKRIKFMDTVIATSLLIFIPCIIFLIIWLYGPARHSIYTYFNYQIVASLKGTNVDTAKTDRLFLLKELFNQLIFMIICLGLVIVTWRIWFKNQTIKRNYRLAVFFLLLALFSSFPIMISKKQLIHYALCSMPFYAISGALFIFPEIKFWISRVDFNTMPFRIISLVMMICLAGVFSFSILRINTNNRDKTDLGDLDVMANQLPMGKLLNCSNNVSYNFGLKAYLYRFYDISMVQNPQLSDYFLVTKEDLPNVYPTYKRISNGTTKFILFKRMDNK